MNRPIFPKSILEYTSRSRAVEFLTLGDAANSVDICRNHISGRASRNINLAMAYAYALGMVDGKRTERARRKGGVQA